MLFPHLEPHALGRLTVGLVLLSMLASAAPGHACATEPDTGRVLARIAGEVVTADDADLLRAVLSPPPSREAAERLAVDVSLVWWSEHGTLAGSSARQRLAAWRQWLIEVEKNTEPGRLGQAVVRRLDAIRTRAGEATAAARAAN